MSSLKTACDSERLSLPKVHLWHMKDLKWHEKDFQIRSSLSVKFSGASEELSRSRF